MVIKYKLKLKENSIPENTTLLQYGSLLIQSELQKYPSGLEYIHNECVGAFIRENNSKDVSLYTVKDFGDKVSCMFLVKESARVYYLSGYNKEMVIEEILISDTIKDDSLIAEKIIEEYK